MPEPEDATDTYLETARLRLRRLTPDDVANLVDLDADPEVMRYISGGRPTPRAVVQDRVLPMMLACYERFPGFGFWAAIEKSSGDFLGWFCLRPHDEAGIDNAGLGYRLRRAAWGKGYATEGAHALVDKAFTELGVRRVFAMTYGENAGSRRVMEKAGLQFVRAFRFTPEELGAEDTYDASAEEQWPGEDVEYALDRPEWESQKSAAAQRAGDEIAQIADV
jgi:RimJ/RimL family protein N-acetyltransferase